ncbi:glycosyltransferase [Ichthyenterobacterium sp. W332]|uniref:Glycosyltransferase n=1 Tax=Microcosmobacter mediterraneus TaxID=3075607 RepID=A0ABU2YGP2_9FLAO|nr:glycosyltransferase [Ichthyenterobacterium sp. W332]MDT0557344.1 glycosyltransferase [Ichthyenterobacterium sp. W332]
MSEDPLVSVIIPTFNRAMYITDTLDSIINQTYTNWECLVVDDGSTDNTKELVLKYTEKDYRIKYLKRTKEFSKGSNGSRNYGLSQSKGEYIAFSDDDDFWLKNKLERQIPIFKKYPDVGLVTCDIEYVNRDGLRSGRVICQTGNHGYIFEQILFKNRLSMVTPILKREVFNKVGEFNTNFSIYEDWDYWRRVAYYYPFYSVKEVLACYRLHDSNTMLKVNKNPFEQYYRYRALTKALLEWGDNRFKKSDYKLIARVEWKRYKQILNNHCPGYINKLKLILKISISNLVEGLKFIGLFLRYELLNND